MFRLNNKIALVTGAASGIGAAIAEAFARQGALVYLADLDPAGAEAKALAIAAAGGQAAGLALDVSSEDSVRHAVQKIQADCGRIDLLVNNAGVGAVGTILESEATDLDRLYAVNVRGVFLVTKAILPGMLARRHGAIINLASIGGIVGIRDRLAYCTSKFAVVGMTKSLALDHSASGVRINCLCPGRVETPFVQARLKEYPDPEKAYQEMASTQLNGRMCRPEEVAAAAVYLASDEAAMVTGTAMMVDGGWSAGK